MRNICCINCGNYIYETDSNVCSMKCFDDWVSKNTYHSKSPGGKEL